VSPWHRQRRVPRFKLHSGKHRLLSDSQQQLLLFFFSLFFLGGGARFNLRNFKGVPEKVRSLINIATSTKYNIFLLRSPSDYPLRKKIHHGISLCSTMIFGNVHSHFKLQFLSLINVNSSLPQLTTLATKQPMFGVFLVLILWATLRRCRGWRSRAWAWVVKTSMLKRKTGSKW